MEPRARVLPLFREQVIRSARLRWFGPVRVMMPPSAGVAVFAAIITLSLLVVAIVLIEIPDRVRTSGLLMPIDGLRVIKASRSGKVRQLFIRDGASVDAGDVLLRLSGIEQAPGREPELQARIASLERELDLLDRGLDGDLAAFQTRVSLNLDRLVLTRERVRSAQAEFRTRSKQQRLHESRAVRLERLVNSAAIPVQHAEDAAATALQAKAASESARQRLLELEDRILLIEQQIERDRSEAGAMRSRAGARREELGRRLAESHLQSTLEVRAPASGVVNGLTVSVGEFVSAGAVLATLHDPDSRIEARLYLDPAEAGRITRGQRVEVRISAFPHELYGTLSGVVESISSAAIPTNEFDSGPRPRKRVFEIRATLATDAIADGGHAWKLPPGTSISADIVRRRWPLYRWLWRSVAGSEPHT